MLDRVRRYWAATFTLAWALIILMLPVTSLPLLIKFSGSNMVAPPSAILLLWLLAFWFIPYLFHNGSMPRQFIPLLAFITAVVVSSGLAFFLNMPSYRDKSFLSREVQAFLTLGVGISFYLIASLWPNTTKKLESTLRWINWSGLILLGWSALQAFFWYTSKSYPAFMYKIQGVLTPTAFFYDRVSGFAFEPSWLAHQLNMVYLPLWLAATALRTSAHRFRILGISFENILLAGGVAVLLLSLSRIGELGFLLSVAFLLLLGNLYLIKRIQARLVRRFSVRPSLNRLFRGGVTIAILLAFLAAYAGLALGFVYGASRLDYRMARLFQTQLSGQSFFQYANNLVFAERLVFWDAGWRIFNDFPILGVGIGNAGFYFTDKLPAFAWALTEVETLMFHLPTIPNTKNLWVRLLAETGVVGFALFLTWLYTLWRSAQFLRTSQKPLFKTVGLAGLLILVALVSEGFSIDSFALPYFWFSLGLVTAACTLAVRETRRQEENPVHAGESYQEVERELV